MSLSSSSGSTWSEADPWSEQAKYLSSTAEGGKNQALFDSAYDMWQNIAKDPIVGTKKVDKYGDAIKDSEGNLQYDISRPHVFGEQEAAQKKLNSQEDVWADKFITNARTGNLGDQYISTVADFMSPQTEAQGNTLDMARNQYNAMTPSDYSSLTPYATSSLLNIMSGSNAIDPSTMSAAKFDGYNTMYPVTTLGGTNMTAANAGSVTDNINRSVGTVQQQGSYSPTFGYNDALGNIATGQYVGSNPYLDAMYNSARDKLYKEYSETMLPEWDTRAEALGRDDSNVWAQGRADLGQNYLDSLGSLSANLYGNAYEGDMSRMLQGLGLGSQQSQFEDTMTQDINRYNTDIQNRKKFEEAGYDYGADTLMANLEMNRLLQNAGYSQEANRLTSEQALQKALQLGLWQQDANQINTQMAYDKAAQQAGYQQEANRINTQTDFESQMQNLANQMAMAQYAPDLAMRAYDPIQQIAGVGDIQQQQAQDELDAAVRQGEFLESIPTNMLGTFANMISGNYGGTQMTESESGK